MQLTSSTHIYRSTRLCGAVGLKGTGFPSSKHVLSVRGFIRTRVPSYLDLNLATTNGSEAPHLVQAAPHEVEAGGGSPEVRITGRATVSGGQVG
eukprot:4663364-Prymnesium_polylepis.2